ncbi:MAG: hypothetical protein QOK31_1187 [Solirubrobacteraceae bacterium]|nr:hypothetical protein [Solirubrobacteraceae bacterium]
MTLLARVAFVLLVGATLAAFVVTQHLKRTPPVLLHASARPAFISPNADGVQDRARIGFETKRHDEATVSIIDESSGDPIRHLGRRIARPHVLVRLAWDGKDDEGGPAPDGRYRVRVDLRSEGRSITVPGAIVVDRRPPALSVARVSPRTLRGPVVLPARGARGVSVRLRGYFSRAPVLFVYRTDTARPQVVARRLGRPGGGHLAWEGEIQGRPAPAGTYVLAVRARDLAGNVATLPARLPPTPSMAVRGLGVTIRYVSVTPPMVPVAAGAVATFGVDARRRAYVWAVRAQVGRRALAEGASSARRLRVGMSARRAPGGVYELTVRAGGARVTTPFVLRATRRQRVLIVLPAVSWLGRDPVDDDGDGFPDMLAGGDSIPVSRPFAGPPGGFRRDEAPLLALAHASRWRYDVTTDLALAEGRPPRLAGHRGVLLAGAPEWEPAPVAEALRGYVRRGGRVAVLAAGALRRVVTVAGARLLRPSRVADRDAFGVRLGPLRRAVTALRTDPVTGAGALLGTLDPAALGRFEAYEEILAPGPGARIVGAAVAEDGRPVLAALRVGRGLLVRTGLPQWSRRLGRDRAVTAAMRRVWKLLER